jgi:hypothetical protein
MLKVSNLPQRKDCSWKIGTYKIYGYRFPTEKIPPFFDGDYKGEIQLILDGKVANSFTACFTVLKV